MRLHSPTNQCQLCVSRKTAWCCLYQRLCTALGQCRRGKSNERGSAMSLLGLTLTKEKHERVVGRRTAFPESKSCCKDKDGRQSPAPLHAANLGGGVQAAIGVARLDDNSAALALLGRALPRAGQAVRVKIELHVHVQVIAFIVVQAPAVRAHQAAALALVRRRRLRDLGGHLWADTWTGNYRGAMARAARGNGALLIEAGFSKYIVLCTL